MKKLLMAIALFALTSQVNAAPVNLVVNGSFENPDIRSGTWSTYSSIPGWSTTGAGVEIRDNVVGTAYDGTQFAELDSKSNSSIYQTLSTTAGKAYTLTFAYSPRINQPASTNPIEVYWNNALLSSITGTGGKVNNWILYSFVVNGTGQDVLKFAAAGISDSLGGGLDAVSVSAVPLPAALLLFGPALLGFMGLRRKAKTLATV